MNGRDINLVFSNEHTLSGALVGQDDTFFVVEHPLFGKVKVYKCHVLYYYYSSTKSEVKARVENYRQSAFYVNNGEK